MPGLAVVDLPLGLIMPALWCRVLTPPLTALAPRAFAPAGPRARLAAPAAGGYDRVRGVLHGGTAGLAVAVAAYAAGWWLVRLRRG